MPLGRFERLDEDRRRRLLASAAQEFAAEGYEGASLGWIAEEAGFSKPAIYYYFEDKADLYATVVREVWQRLSPKAHLDPVAFGLQLLIGIPVDPVLNFGLAR